VRPDAFEAQITKLLAEGYESVTFTEAVRGGRRGKTLAITFDDAFASVRSIACPILDRLGAVATVYAVTDFAADGRPLAWDGIEHWKGGQWDAELASLDWEALRSLADGGWEIGSHTCDHPHLPRCPDAELQRQLTASRAACEAGMGRPCRSFAYPYGDTDARVEAAAARAGYESAAGLPARLHRARALSWPRVGVWHTDDARRFSIKVSATVRGVRTLVHR
jgi:peptidoglycan/xylan/chitin deacetylase (PgdA/CDA1 family)